MTGPFTIHTSTLFDPKKKAFVSNISITINPQTGCITHVFPRTEELGDVVPEGDIDLRGKITMPGFVDAHTHIFLHSYDEKSSVNQKRDESPTERIIRATNHCRTALLAGYTTYRDLGSESMQDADAHIRDAINRELIPGPRLFVATKVLASTGSYEPRTENEMNGVCLPAGGEAVDGVESARTAVRRRLAHGADIIKFFADYRRRIMRYPPTQQHPYILGMSHAPADPNPDLLVFTQAEIDVIVQEAKMGKAPIACHAKTIEGAIMAIKAGVTTIEHGNYANDEMFRLMVENGTIFVPTLGVAERLHQDRIEPILKQVKRAWELGVKFACGADTGTFPHGQGVRELELMVEAGIPLEEVLAFCSVGGWESCGGELSGLRFGWFEEGCRADIIGLDEDPRVHKKALRKVSFVMKDGKTWKRDGKAVGMVQDEHVWVEQGEWTGTLGENEGCCGS